MDSKKPRVSFGFSRKRKHDTKARQERSTATVYPYNMSVEFETIAHTDQPMPKENNRVYWTVMNSVYDAGPLPKRMSSAPSTSRRPDGNSSSNNEQRMRCRVLNNGQRMPCNDQSVINYEVQPVSVIPTPSVGITANNSSKNPIPIISLVDDYYNGDPAPNNGNIAAARTDRSNNGADGETIEQEMEKRNRELTEWEDAEDAFGRTIALMLKKVRNASDRLKIQAKIYETLAQQLK